MINTEAERVLTFWLEEVGPEGWYGGGGELDARCRAEFAGAWELARGGALDGWRCGPRNCLALLILLDQLPRNMFREDPRAFATDAMAREVTKGAIGRGYDLATDEPQRQFYYMPLEHSEMVPDQERAVRLFEMRFSDRELLRHARAHRLVIRRFGRFPYRNAALDRVSTPEEQAFLAAGGYRAALEEIG